MGRKPRKLEAAKLLRLLRIPDGSSWEPKGPWSRRGEYNPPLASGEKKTLLRGQTRSLKRVCLFSLIRLHASCVDPSVSMEVLNMVLLLAVFLKQHLRARKLMLMLTAQWQRLV